MNYEISHKVLRKLQLVELEILIEFDRICKVNNLPYQLFSGTLLGAVRHKGFIPWDDDIDVCMLRNDYNKFLELCNGQLNKDYFLQTHETDKNYIHSFARIRKNNTIALQRSYSNIDMHHGIFIDIFPLDNIIPTTILGKLQCFILYPFRNIKRLKIKDLCLSSKSIHKKYIKLLFYYLLKPFKMKTLNEIETKIACIFKNENTKMSTCLTIGDRELYNRYMVENNRFYDSIKMEFEGQLLSVPRNYHEILTRIFNDYMTPPSLEKRNPHHGLIQLCFDTTSEMQK